MLSVVKYFVNNHVDAYKIIRRLKMIAKFYFDTASL